MKYKIATYDLRNMGIHLAIGVLVLLFWGVHNAHAAACDHTYQSGSQPEASYGAAWNTLSAEKELLVEGISCQNTEATLKIGSDGNKQYVYKQGYYWNGNQWTSINLNSTNPLLANTWYKGNANGSIPLTDNKSTYAVGFVCQYVNNAWKCGCQDAACTESLWQIQGISEATNTYSGAVLEEPPVMDPNNTVVFENVCPEDAGFPTRNQMAGKDVVITLPSDRVCTSKGSIGGTNSNPSHNLRLIGGEIDIATSDEGGGALTVAWWDGTAMIEGIEIDMHQACSDAIRSYRVKGDGRMVVQNSYLRAPGYCTEGTHGDIIHIQGGEPSVGDVNLNELVVQNVRGDLINQGLFVPYRVDTAHGTKKLVLDHVELKLDTRYKHTENRIATMIYAGSYNGNSDLPPPNGQSYNEVYLNWWDPWYPDTIDRKNSTAPDVIGYDENECGIFSEQTKINNNILFGQWCKGSPPNGTFVPLDKIGLNYDRTYFVGQ